MKKNRITMINYIHVTYLYVFGISFFSVMVYLNHYELDMSPNERIFVNSIFIANFILSFLGLIYVFLKKVGISFLWWRLILSVVYLTYALSVLIILVNKKFAGGKLISEIILLASIVCLIFFVVKNLVKLSRNINKIILNRKFTKSGEFDLSKSYFDEFYADKNTTGASGKHYKYMAPLIVITIPVFDFLQDSFPFLVNLFWVFIEYLLVLMGLIFFAISSTDFMFIYIGVNKFYRKNRSFLFDCE